MKKSNFALLSLGIVLIIVALVALLPLLLNYKKSEAAYQSLRDLYVTDNFSEDENNGDTEDSGETRKTYNATTDWADAISVDFDALTSKNPDIVGWIYFDNNEYINYPILWCGDDVTYLRTDLNGDSAVAGCIFLEGENSPDFSDAHTIIYGHNMRNFSMFGTLKKYKTDGYYSGNEYFTIYTPTAAYRYEIFSYHDVAQDSDIYTVGFRHDDTFSDFIGKLTRASYLDTGMEVSQDDYVVTLSTCSTDGMRFVVHAVMIGAALY